MNYELTHSELVARAWQEIDALPSSLVPVTTAMQEVIEDDGCYLSYMYCDLTNATDLRRELNRANANVTNLLDKVTNMYRELDLAATTGSVMSVYQAVVQIVQRGYKMGFIK